MSAVNLLGLVVSALVAGYLLYALLRGEKF
ncbi:MAG: hypothetical protein V7645_1478 [Actinomycetota bacterium]|jgi:K+-transporting ATPase KdpF subunit